MRRAAGGGDRSNAVTHPTLLVEITSKSIEEHDRGERLSHYKQLPSLTAVLIVSHRRPQVSVIERDGTRWTQRECRAREQVVRPNPCVAFAVDDLYGGIDLELGD